MTGLDPQTDTILSISCYITSATLHPLDPHGYHATILTPAPVLAAMSPWCTTTHTATGLISQCLDPSISIAPSAAAANLLLYIQRFVPERGVAVLAGNSVHVDKLFLMRGVWAPVVEWLHYRILDVSAVKEGVRRWCGEGVLRGCPVKRGGHRAEEDVWESLEEARYYMRLFGGLGGDKEEET